MQDIGGTTLTGGLFPRVFQKLFISLLNLSAARPVRSTSSRCLHHGNYRDFSTQREREREQTGNIYRIVFNDVRELATFKHTG